MKHAHLLIPLLAATALLASGCGRKPAGGAGAAPAEPAAAGPAQTNRIDIPPAVRQNLGITFAKAERRRVVATRRYPGRFEPLPEARREYHVALPGRVEILVKQYERVEPGQALFRLDSPLWREAQEKLALEIHAIKMAHLRLDSANARAVAVRAHGESVRQTIALWTERVEDIRKLEAAGSPSAAAMNEARAHLSAANTERTQVDEELAEIAKERVEVEAEIARQRDTMPLLHALATGVVAAPDAARRDMAMMRLATLTGYDVEELARPAPAGPVGQSRPAAARPAWMSLDRIEVRARQAGVVESLAAANGAWLETGRAVVVTVDPQALRFRALAPQADLVRLRDDLEAHILPPVGGSQGFGPALPARVRLSLEADPLQRTIELVALPGAKPDQAWARAGVSTLLEVVIDGAAEEETAVPASALIQDGLKQILFRRDPKDPDKVIRVEADLGLGDGRWVVIKSSLREGDEVVLGGVYELKLTGAGSGSAKGGHFHADGTWHADGTPEPK